MSRAPEVDLPRFVTDAGRDVSFAGPVTPIAIPSLLHALCTNGETGVLTLRDGLLQKAAYIKAGSIAFARSNDPDDRLGELFLRKGVLTVRGFERCTEEVVKSGQRLGGLLVRERLITADDLIEGVREQVREIIHSMFLWGRGDYHFQRGPLPTNEAITLKVNTCDVIRTGISRIHTWSRIRQAVGGLGSVYVYDQAFDAQMTDLEMSRDEERLLEFLMRPASVEEACATLPGNDFEVCRRIWAFHVMGALARPDVVGSGRSPAGRGVEGDP